MVSFDLQNFLTVDNCNMESAGSVVVDRTFTLESVDLRAQAYSLIIAA